MEYLEDLRNKRDFWKEEAEDLAKRYFDEMQLTKKLTKDLNRRELVTMIMLPFVVYGIINLLTSLLS